MDTIFMNSKNSETPLSLTDKIKLKRSYKYVALSNLGIYYTWKNITKSYKSNKFNISAPTWNEEFELPYGSYSIWDFEDCFEYIFKKRMKKKLEKRLMILQ